MDTSVKIAIVLFVSCCFILFFKATKQMSKNYLKNNFQNRVDINDMINYNDYKESNFLKEIPQQQEEEKTYIDEINDNIDINNINWVVKE